MNLKQIFCRHKPRRVGYNHMKTVREPSGRTVIGLPVYANYDYFTEFFICDKCRKETHRHTKYLAKDHRSSVLY